MLPDEKLKIKNTEIQETILSRMGGMSNYLLADDSLSARDNIRKFIHACLL